MRVGLVKPEGLRSVLLLRFLLEALTAAFITRETSLPRVLKSVLIVARLLVSCWSLAENSARRWLINAAGSLGSASAVSTAGSGAGVGAGAASTLGAALERDLVSVVFSEVLDA